MSQQSHANRLRRLRGWIFLTVASKAGKEATIGIVGEGNFLGEGLKVALHD